MTKLKFCGLSRDCDIAAANALLPDYIGFVFAPKSRRHVDPDTAARLKARLSPAIQAVGVFVNEAPETILGLLKAGTIDIVQLHGSEDPAYVQSLRQRTDAPILQAFRVRTPRDIELAQDSPADFVLLDSEIAGSGRVFDWALIASIRRPYFLAGGLNLENVGSAVRALHPYAVDVSSGIETNGVKDPEKMKAFSAAVRKEGIE